MLIGMEAVRGSALPVQYEWDAFNAEIRSSNANKSGVKAGDSTSVNPLLLQRKKGRRATKDLLCQVDGCGQELSSEKAYLQRYSVCDVHFKAPTVLISGAEMRFCQQCNKFQHLREFEGVRRSCAARSNDRNARRRQQAVLQQMAVGSEEGWADGAMVLAHKVGAHEGRSGGHGLDDVSEGSQAVAGGGFSPLGDGRVGGEKNYTALGAGGQVASVALPVPTSAAAATSKGTSGNGVPVSRGASGQMAVNEQPSAHAAAHGDGAPAATFGVSVMRPGRLTLPLPTGQETRAPEAHPATSNLQLRNGDAACPELPGWQHAAGRTDGGSLLHSDPANRVKAVTNPTSRSLREVEAFFPTCATSSGAGRAAVAPPPQPGVSIELDSTCPDGAAQQHDIGGGNGCGAGSSRFGASPWGTLQLPARAGSLPEAKHTGLQLSGPRRFFSVGQAHLIKQEPGRVKWELGNPTLAGGDEGGDVAAALLEQLQQADTQEQQQQQRLHASASGVISSGPQTPDDLALIVQERRTMLLQQQRNQQAQQLRQQRRTEHYLPGDRHHQQHQQLGLLLHDQQSQQQWQQQQLQLQGRAQQHTYPSNPHQQPPGPPQRNQSVGLQGVQSYQRHAVLDLSHATDTHASLQLQQQQQRLPQQPPARGPGLGALGTVEGAMEYGELWSSGSRDLKLAGVSARGSSGAVSVAAEAGRRGVSGVQQTFDRGIEAGNHERLAAQAAEILQMQDGSKRSGAATDTMDLLRTHALSLEHSGGGPAPDGSGLASGLGGPGAGAPRSGASGLLAQLLPAAVSRGDVLATRVCLKLFDCVPGDLPPDLLTRLKRWAMVAEMDFIQVFMRPGCVHLVANVRRRGGIAAMQQCILGGAGGDGDACGGDLVQAVAALRGAFESSGLLHGRRVLVQAGEGPGSAFVHDDGSSAAAGRSSVNGTKDAAVASSDTKSCQGTKAPDMCQARWVTEEESEAAPGIAAIWPAAITCGAATELTLVGRNLQGPGVRLFARCAGRSYELHPLFPQLCDSDTDSVPEQECLEGAQCGHAGATLSAAPCTLDSSDASMPSQSFGTDCDSGPASPQVRGAAHGNQRRVHAMGGILAEQAHQDLDCALSAQGTGLACDGLDRVHVMLPALPVQGLLAVEAVDAQMGLMGAWAAGVAVADPTAAAEVEAWVRGLAPEDTASGRWLLLELGTLLDHDAAVTQLTGGLGVANQATVQAGLMAEDGAAAVPSPATAALLPQELQQHGPLASPASARSVPSQNLTQQGSAVAARSPLGPTQLPRLLSVAPVRSEAGSEHEALPVTALSGQAMHLRTSSSSPLIGMDALSAAAAPSAEHMGGWTWPPDLELAPQGIAVSVLHCDFPGSDMSDDTREVPDAVGRAVPSAALPHPQLHPGCRREMTTAAARLLVYSTACGLPLLASGLLEWLIAVESPSLAAEAARVGAPRATATAKAFVRACAHVRTATAGATAVGPTASGPAKGPTSRESAGPGSPRRVSNGPCASECSLSSSASVGGARAAFRPGLGLLHLAIASGSTAMAQQALEWVEEYGVPWRLDERAGAGAATPLHLAAALRDGGEVARLLLAVGGPTAQTAWLSQGDAFGRTAADVAVASGLVELNRLCLEGACGEDSASLPSPCLSSATLERAAAVGPPNTAQRAVRELGSCGVGWGAWQRLLGIVGFDGHALAALAVAFALLVMQLLTR